MKGRELSFQEGLARIDNALKAQGVSKETMHGGIVTSRDPIVAKIVDALKIKNLPSELNGFSKWQLPIAQDGPTQFFITVAPPDASVPKHSHDEGDGVRVIVAGSIKYDGKELTAGDWMFIPKGKPYSFDVGPFGATMCYCYQCCCVPV